jgi:hypothetical protein
LLKAIGECTKTYVQVLITEAKMGTAELKLNVPDGILSALNETKDGL